jgi:hypothetical protein
MRASGPMNGPGGPMGGPSGPMHRPLGRTGGPTHGPVGSMGGPSGPMNGHGEPAFLGWPQPPMGMPPQGPAHWSRSGPGGFGYDSPSFHDGPQPPGIKGMYGGPGDHYGGGSGYPYRA